MRINGCVLYNILKVDRGARSGSYDSEELFAPSRAAREKAARERRTDLQSGCGC
jgi:hypothetical protein